MAGQSRPTATAVRGEATGARRNRYGSVVDLLGQRIVGGEFGEGASLPVEPELAAQMGVGRNLLREAMKSLTSKGLVEVRPRSGTRVRPRADWHLLDPDVLGWLDAVGERLPHAFNLVEFRLIVEPAAARLAALRASHEEKQRILAALVALEACIGRPDQVPLKDIAFHRSILAASHNAVLNHLGALITSLMQIQVLATTDHPGAFERGLPLHREVTEAILRSDAAGAEDASRRLAIMPYLDLASRLRVEPEVLLTASGERGEEETS